MSGGLLRLASAAALVLGTVGMAPASAGFGQPSPWQKGLQEPATEMARQINAFHDVLLWIIVVITLFVLALLLWVMFRYNENANPTPSRNSHNTALEVAWTILPIFILLFIAIPSFRLLYRQYDFPKPDVTIKAIGHQWYWTHEYPDLGFSFDSVMVRDEDVLKREHGDAQFAQRYQGLSDKEKAKRMYADSKDLYGKTKQVRMLSVDNDVVLPVGKVVHVLVTADDVIHNWTIPAFGSKTDAVPGRVTATWFKAEKTGIFYGQCSELCGKDHAAMPIAVRIVSDSVFADWAAAMKAKDKKKAREIIEKASAEEAADSRLAAAPAAAR
jgi:cytochrome c oxidase subunit 2